MLFDMVDVPVRAMAARRPRSIVDERRKMGRFMRIFVNFRGRLGEGAGVAEAGVLA